MKCNDKRQGKEVSSGAFRGARPCQPLDFSPVELISDFCPGLQATGFAASCYSSREKLMQLGTKLVMR